MIDQENTKLKIRATAAVEKGNFRELIESLIQYTAKAIKEDMLISSGDDYDGVLQHGNRAILKDHADLMEEVMNQMKERIDGLEAYADKLAAGLPEGMLPKDIESLRESNAQMATRIQELEAEIEHLWTQVDGG